MGKLRLWWRRLLAALAPAWDEIAVYPCALVGVLLSPIVVAAAADQAVRLRVRWLDFAVSLVLTVAVLAAFELKGTPEGKRGKAARWRRYTFAFFGGLAWRQVVPAVVNLVVGLFSALTGLVQ
jgi:hypothetical protein